MNVSFIAILIFYLYERFFVYIPALSMHDGLIVPVSGAELAEQALKRVFSKMKINCRVKIFTQRQVTLE